MKFLKKVNTTETFVGVAKCDADEFKRAVVSKGDKLGLMVKKESYIAKNQNPIGVRIRYFYDSLDWGLAVKEIDEDSYYFLLDCLDSKTMKFDKKKIYKTVGLLF